MTNDDFDHNLAAAWPTLFVLASGLVGRSDAADVVQEACMLAYQRREAFQTGTSFTAWTAAFVRNTAANHARARRRRGLRLLKFASSPNQPSVSTAASSPTSFAEANPTLAAAVDALAPVQRACLLLRVIQGLSYAEIASSLDIAEPTARSHVLRARRALADALAPEPGGHHDPQH